MFNIRNTNPSFYEFYNTLKNLTYSNLIDENKKIYLHLNIFNLYI